MNKSLFKQPFFYTSILALIALGLIIGSYVFGWVVPTATPPGGNITLSQGALPAGSAGYVQFAQSSTAFGGDAGLFWDNTNKRLGIGTTGPGYKLDVSGDIRATGIVRANANGAAYFCGGDDACLYDVNVANTVGLYGVQNSAVGTLRLGSGGADISGSGGNVGIGTTTPAYTLDVNGALRLQPSGVPSAAKGTIFYDQSTDTFKGYQGSGWVNIYTGSQTGYTISTVSGATSATAAKSAAATILISPIFIPFTINVNSFLVQVTTILGATGDVGLYNSNGTLLLNGGSGTLTTATGLKSVAPVQTGSARLIPPGQYYVAITWNSATGVIAGVNVTYAGFIPRSGTITGGGSVLPSSLTLANITTTTYLYAVTLSGSNQEENGAICTVAGDCLSGICYIDNDSDIYYGSSGTSYCRSVASLGVDCNDSCATCYPGSTAYTTSPDGLDQDCDGTIDETLVIGCTPVYGGALTAWKYNDACSWISSTSCYYSTTNHGFPNDTTHCAYSNHTCSAYAGGWGNCTTQSVYGMSYGAITGCDVSLHYVCYPCSGEECFGDATLYYTKCYAASGCNPINGYQ